MVRLTVIFVLIFTGFGSFTQERDQGSFYLGADLSYVNELLDCGAEYRYNGELVDPYQLFAEKGANISRIRLWHSPGWTDYSDYEDVALAIQRSKAVGMDVLLDFHYSDTWADPQHQVIPQAWRHISDHDLLKDSLYHYTYGTLKALHAKGLSPEFVQIGNEVNIEIMQDSASMVVDTINWSRNLSLLNAGLKAAHDFSTDHSVNIETMIHIAQPENALWWFSEARQHGIADFDWIGLSYYPKWSAYGIDSLGIALDSLISTYGKDVMIVETAYPHTLNDVDQAGNILGKDALIPGYPATPKGQYDFLERLIEITRKSGGKGVIYWEPAWVTSDCSTLWGQGSHWDNATFFDGVNGNEALPVFDLFGMR
ncbi:MAG: glycosyl hydrolase 53 family protein [Bacteroidota bacterium]